MANRAGPPRVAVSRHGATGTGAQPRHGMGGTGAVTRPGATNTPDYGGAQVHDPGLAAQIQQQLPGILSRAPQGFGAGPHGGGMSGDASMVWLTGELRKAGVPLQDGQHVLPTGQVVKDPSWWDRYGGAVMLAGAGLAVGYGLGAIPGLGGGGYSGHGLLGFLGDGSVADGINPAMPGALNSIPGLSGAAGGAAGSGAGVGVMPGLLGPSAETAADLVGAGSAAAGTLGPSTAANMAATTSAMNAAPPAAISAGTGAAASQIPGWLGTAARIGAPLAAGALAGRNSSSNSQPGAGGGMDPELLAQMKKLIALSTSRLERQQPVHEAAMRLAQNMAPNGSYSPGMANAIQQTGTPQYQGAPLSPNVLAAIEHLRGGR